VERFPEVFLARFELLAHFSREYSLLGGLPIFATDELDALRTQLFFLGQRLSPSSFQDLLVFCCWLRFRFRRIPVLLFDRLFDLLERDGDARFPLVREIFVATCYQRGDRAESDFPRLLGWLECQLVRENASAQFISDSLFRWRRLPGRPGDEARDVVERMLAGLRQTNVPPYRIGRRCTPGRARPQSLSLVLTHCMAGSGDMSLFCFLATSARLRYPSARITLTLGDPRDRDHLLALLPDFSAPGVQVGVKVPGGDADCPVRDDVAIYVTLPWSYGNGVRPGSKSPRGRLTVHLCGLDWNRSQRVQRCYSDGSIEVTLPIGFSSPSYCDPLSLLPRLPGVSLPLEPPALVRGIRGYTPGRHGILYASYDARILGAFLVLAARLLPEGGTYFVPSVLRAGDPPSHSTLREITTSLGLCYHEFSGGSPNLDLDPAGRKIVALPTIPQEEYLALLSSSELPCLVTGTMSLLLSLASGKPFVHIGSIPNARLIKHALVGLVHEAHAAGSLDHRGCDMILSMLGIVQYRYQEPADPFELRMESLGIFDQPGLAVAMTDLRDHLARTRTGLWDEIEILLASAAGDFCGARHTRIGPVPYGFEDVFDPDAGRVWNRFRYHYQRDGDAAVALRRLRDEYSPEAILSSVEANEGHPYYCGINAVLKRAFERSSA